jgi:hypothetical protein
MAAFALAMALASLVSLEITQRRLIPGELEIERATRRVELAESRALLSTPTTPPTVVLVDRFGIHRLLALDRSLSPTPAGWSAWGASGVALVARNRPLAFAERLSARQADSLRAAGWRILDAQPAP